MKHAWGVIATGLVCSLVAASAVAAEGTRVVFTIDVESNQTFQLPDQIEAVCNDGSACGLMEIVRLLDAKRSPGTFFLDVYEHKQWGTAAMRKLAVRLQDAGHDVALHTHPQWAYDPARSEMHRYSVDEQTTIVRDGVRLLEEWTGRPVVAHRAGAYTADEGTLIALQRNGVLIDSSLWWQYPNSRLGGLGLPRNLPARYAGVVEIPVTAYQRDGRPGSLGRMLSPITAVRKIDPNWFTDAAEVTRAIDGVLAAKVPVLVVFLHSFSFMTPPAGGGAPVADRHALEMFRVIVDQVARHRLPVVTMRDLAEALPALPAVEPDVVPHVDVSVGLASYAWHRSRSVGQVSSIVVVGLACLCAGILLGRARRRGNARRRTAQPGAASAVPTRVGIQ